MQAVKVSIGRYDVGGKEVSYAEGIRSGFFNKDLELNPNWQANFERVFGGKPKVAPVTKKKVTAPARKKTASRTSQKKAPAELPYSGMTLSYVDGPNATLTFDGVPTDTTKLYEALDTAGLSVDSLIYQRGKKTGAGVARISVPIEASLGFVDKGYKRVEGAQATASKTASVPFEVTYGGGKRARITSTVSGRDMGRFYGAMESAGFDVSEVSQKRAGKQYALSVEVSKEAAFAYLASQAAQYQTTAVKEAKK